MRDLAFALVLTLVLPCAPAIAAPASAHESALPPLPSTPQRPVSRTYHGVTVVDPYEWLERGDDPEVQAWTSAQDAHARAWLARVPGIDWIRTRVREVLLAKRTSFGAPIERGGRLFATRSQPPAPQPVVVALDGPDAAAQARVILDPAALDPTGKTSFDWFVPSLDGALVAASISVSGKEDGTVHVYEVATGKERPDRIPRVNSGTAGGSLTWVKDGFYYTRHPAPGERPPADMGFYQEVWFHRLGTPASEDVYAEGREFVAPRIAEHALRSSRDGAWVVDLVQKGDGGEFETWLRGPEGGWRRISTLADKVVDARFGEDGGLWLLARKDAPRGRILRLALPGGDLAKASVVAEAGAGAIDDLAVTTGRLYVAEIAGGPSRLRVLDLGGKPVGEVALPPVSGVGALTTLGRDEVLYSVSRYTAPTGWYATRDGALEARRTSLSTSTTVSLDDVEVVREECTSKDGTKVPLTVLRRKGTRLDGKNPTLLSGYGGYGLSETPRFMSSARPWFDAGGVYAIAHVRGGGEWGEPWHLAGNLLHKQNVFDDFAACAERLVALHYTRPERLALEGGSNGGILMGAMITQHPGLARAVLAKVPVLDMLRVETHPNGAFNVTEYGTVKDAAQFKALLAYSPVHHVVPGTEYPAVYLSAGLSDPRVDPYHARKMAALLQAASRSGRPVLLRVSGFGHGIGSPLEERVTQATDAWAFTFGELGVRPPPDRGAGAGPR
jgi:prolyl oligopeptidase